MTKTISSPTRPPRSYSVIMLEALLLCALGSSLFPARGDSLELVNGDLYSGILVGMTASNFVFQSEIQGVVTLPKSKVAQIIFRDVAPSKANTSNSVPTPPSRPTQFSLQFTNRPGRSTSAPANSANTVVRQLRQQGVDPKLVSQVQEQILGKSTPEASQKFDELLGGLINGKLSLDDIRSQAKTSLQNIQEAKKVMGDDVGGVLDGYVVILQNFLGETEPPSPDRNSVTNTP